MKMKMIHINFAVLLLFFNFSCEDVNNQEWGNAYIYMPQASMLNGGLNNNYPVPLPNASTDNFLLEDEGNTLKVVLGVYQSGKVKLSGYSVSVSPNISATELFIKDNDNRVILPEGSYTLPDKINVKKGERQEIFYLTVDLGKLKSIHPTYNSKNICLTVEISDPSKYELNETLSKTNIIIDGSVFGGD